MPFSPAQAKRKAEQIITRFGARILKSCQGTDVDPFFVCGFIGIEAGVDRAGKIIEQATRFEPGVYRDLVDLRDTGRCIVGGKERTDYSGVKRSQIKDASDAALRALATSYGISQIMGWHCINNLHCTIAELRDPAVHLYYTVKLLEIVGGTYLHKKNYPAVFRIWNTGSANGKTFHEDYVDNGMAVMQAARARPTSLWPDMADLVAQPLPPLAPELHLADRVAGTEADPDPDHQLAGGSWTQEMAGDEQKEAPDAPASSSEQPAATQQADQIINVGADAAGAGSDPNKEPEPFQEKTIQTPLAGRLKEKISSWFVWFGLAPPGAAAVFKTAQELRESGSVNIGSVLGQVLEVFFFVFPFVAGLGGLYIVYRIIKMIFVQITFLVQMWIQSDRNRHDLILKPPPSENDQEPKSLRIF